MPDIHSVALPPGSRIAEYEIVRVLGAGGFGITYLAFDRQLDGPGALKEYFPADIATRVDGSRVAATAPTNQETFAWGLERFLDEARAIHRFRHPNVMRAHRYLEANATAYIVMEYVEGESLKAILDRRGRLPADEWRQWMDALLGGLAHVHSHGYLHRDIKPANIVVRAEDGEPVLIDFGSARLQHRNRTHTQVLTAGYAPIEQYSSDAVQGPPADIYALAAVSHRVLTGSPVPSAPDRVLNDDCRPLANRIAGAERRWLAAIDHGLALEPQNRPPNVEEWRAALGTAEGAGPSASGARQPETAEPTDGNATESARRFLDEALRAPEHPPVPGRSRHLWWAVPALFTLAIVILRLNDGPIGEPQAFVPIPTSEPEYHPRVGTRPGEQAPTVGNPRNDSPVAGSPAEEPSQSSRNPRPAESGSEAQPAATVSPTLPASRPQPRTASQPNDPEPALGPADHGTPERDSSQNEVHSAPPRSGDSPTAVRSSSSGDEADDSGQGPSAYFTRGSHQDDVLRVQGTPTSIDRYEILGHETWSYGLSSVTISTRTRQVLDWSNHRGQLNVRLLPGDSGTATSWFTRGSHQDDVLRVQGTPTSIDRYEILGHETWSYGLSSVTISTRTRQILDWSNHRGQLKVRLLPGDSGTNASWFTRGSHQDDVLRVQGTPTSIDRFEVLGHERWSYGSSTVTISTRTRQVLDWSNHRGQLKVRSSGQQ